MSLTLTSCEPDMATIRILLQKRRWTEEEYRILKEFLRITPAEVQEALTRVDIEGLLAGLGIHFPARATNPQISCFMHPDYTPSLTLYRMTNRARFPNTCYCYGCRQSLNPVSVMIRLYGRTYPEALDFLLGSCLAAPRQLLRREILARFKQGRNESGVIAFSNRQAESLPELLHKEITLRLPSRWESATQEAGESYQSLAKIPEVRAVLAAAVEYYHWQLRDCPAALEYLDRRGLAASTISTASLGYSSGQGLVNWLRDRQLDLKLTREIGLLTPDNTERMSGRIILPAAANPAEPPSGLNPVIFLTGRLLPGSAAEAPCISCRPEAETVNGRERTTGELNLTGAMTGLAELSEPSTASSHSPKYLSLRLPRPTENQIETIVSLLHDQQQTGSLSDQPEICNLQEPYLLLVEGPFDYLIARQWGYQAVCVYGTALANGAVEKLRQALAAGVLKRLYLCFDADPETSGADGLIVQGAGQRASDELLLKLNSDRVSKLELPPGFKDIASLAETKEGRHLFELIFRQQLTKEDVM